MGLILRDDCSLIIKNNKPFIKMPKHEIPISKKGAIFISLLNGTRTLEEVKNILLDINLNNPSKLDYFIKNLFFQYNHFIVDSSDFQNNPNTNYSIKDFLLIENHSSEEFYDTSIPRSILFHVTEHCDKQCKYCYLDAKNGILETDALTSEQILKIIDEAAELGIYSITYMGGEPLLRKDLTDIIVYASSKGIYNKVTTKFYLTEDQIKKLANSKVEINLSYDCHIDDLASYLVGRDNHAKNMDNVIKLLVKYGVKFSINPVITGLTVKYLEEFFTYLSKLGVSEVILSRYSPSLGRNDKKFIVTEDQWNYVQTLSKTFKTLEVNFLHPQCGENNNLSKNNSHGEPSLCINGRSCMSILPNGKVVMCERIPNKMDFYIGDLTQNTIAEIWASEKRQQTLYPSKEFYKNTPCGNCNDFSTCKKKLKCVLVSLIESGTPYMPPHEIRKNCDNYLKYARKC